MPPPIHDLCRPTMDRQGGWVCGEGAKSTKKSRRLYSALGGPLALISCLMLYSGLIQHDHSLG